MDSRSGNHQRHDHADPQQQRHQRNRSKGSGGPGFTWIRMDQALKHGGEHYRRNQQRELDAEERIDEIAPRPRDEQREARQHYEQQRPPCPRHEAPHEFRHALARQRQAEHFQVDEHD